MSNRLASFLKRFKKCLCLLLFVLLAGCETVHVLLPGPDAGREMDVVAAVPAGVEANALRAAVDVYRQETGLIVQVAEYSVETYGAKLEGILLSGRADFDLVFLPASQLPRWVGYNALRPITKPIYPSTSSTLVNGGIPRSLHLWNTNLTLSGQLYGFPTQPAVEGVWYRSDLLAQTNLQPPLTWDEFRALAHAFDQPPERYGLALAAGDQAAAGEFAALLAGFGGQVFYARNDDPASLEIGLDQPAAQQALAFYAALWDEPGLAAPEGLNSNRAASRDALRSGRAAMAILPLTEGPLLLDCTVSPAVCVQAEGLPAKSSLAFAPLPGLPAGTAVGELGAWAIPYHAGRSAAAQDFAAWLVGEEGARVWAQNGGIPAWQGLWQQAQLAEIAPYLAALEGIDTFHLPILPVRNSSQVEGVLHAGVHAAASGQMDPAQAALSMTAQLRRLLHQAGYSTE